MKEGVEGGACSLLENKNSLSHRERAG